MRLAATFSQVAHAFDVPKLVREKKKCQILALHASRIEIEEDERSSSVQHCESSHVRADLPQFLVTFVFCASADDDDRPIGRIFHSMRANEINASFAGVLLRRYDSRFLSNASRCHEQRDQEKASHA